MRPIIYEDESGAWDADDISELIKEIEQHEAITEAAKFLVKVRSHKDTQPAQYQASMPIAWRKLEEAVK